MVVPSENVFPFSNEAPVKSGSTGDRLPSGDNRVPESSKVKTALQEKLHEVKESVSGRRKSEGNGDELVDDDEDETSGGPTAEFTDVDGWIYADNKWEGGSTRGGMGKVR